jgi:hypothetical protein
MADQRRTAGNLCRNVAIYFSPADKAALFVLTGAEGAN